MQQKWKEAAQSLEKSLSRYELQIDSAVHADSEFMREQHAKNLRMSEALARDLLFRDDRQQEAMNMLEKACQEAIQSSATPGLIQQIISTVGGQLPQHLGTPRKERNGDARPPASQ
jgi:hypothetical protein